MWDVSGYPFYCGTSSSGIKSLRSPSLSIVASHKARHYNLEWNVQWQKCQLWRSSGTHNFNVLYFSTSCFIITLIILLSILLLKSCRASWIRCLWCLAWCWLTTPAGSTSRSSSSPRITIGSSVAADVDIDALPSAIVSVQDTLPDEGHNNVGLSQIRLRMTIFHQNPPFVASAPVQAPLNQHHSTVPANQDAGSRSNVHILCLRGRTCMQVQSNLC